MVKAIKEWEGVDRIPCSAHTLQLCVIKGLKKAKKYINRFKKLNIFFSSPKQNERLEEAQAELAVRLGKQYESEQIEQINQLSNKNNQVEIQKES